MARCDDDKLLMSHEALNARYRYCWGTLVNDGVFSLHGCNACTSRMETSR